MGVASSITRSKSIAGAMTAMIRICAESPGFLAKRCYQRKPQPRFVLSHEGRERFVEMSGKNHICSFDK
jgi:hypothetical protein